MSTIEQIMAQLKGGPKTSGELRKILGKSSGAISGALWRLEHHKTVKAEDHDGRGRIFELTGKPYSANTHASPAVPITRKRRRTHAAHSVTVQATVRIELPGKSPMILTLAEASRLYEALGSVAAQLLGNTEGSK